ncbi:hypothetical protein T12_10901 [Trichinella patagoniensis]|uniref:Uncharacterized protein n=1 Tax=Trichinella patagoniensis TaxID=990121 RepID=A0A0V0ZIA2_9BILA|nr:hypothetical protein T12_10901 [Trichinella patagoniensis]
MITPSVKGSSSAATGVAGLTCTVTCKNRQLPETNADQKDDNKTAQYDGPSTELNLGFGYVNWVSGLTDEALERCQHPKQIYEPAEEIITLCFTQPITVLHN